MLRFYITLLGVTLSWLTATAQKISNVNATVSGQEVIISYRLEGEAGKAYQVQVYASHNNYSTPLRDVSGDVNSKRLLAGGTKTLRWNPQSELKSFDGDIEFELRAVPAAPLFTDITTSAQKVKRGKSVDIRWNGSISAPVEVELIKGSDVIVAGKGQKGQLTYATSSKMKTGTYSIRLKSGGEFVMGNSFQVTPKVPLLLKLAPLVAVGAVIGLAGGGGSDPAPVEETKLVGPPDLTGN